MLRAGLGEGKRARIIILFEGRDAAGKGGTIKAITEKVSPRVFRVVALPAPSDREKTQMYLQRYLEHFPAAGEIVIFDRSWYNRAGVENVMGFTSAKDVERFLSICPEIEKYITDAGIILIKFWLEVGQEEQERRFFARINDPLRQWKLSPMDLESYGRWYDFSLARDAMLKATDVDYAPWHIVRSDDKRRGRLNCIAQILELVPYKKVSRPRIKLPKRSTKKKYDDQASIAGKEFCCREILIQQDGTSLLRPRGPWPGVLGFLLLPARQGEVRTRNSAAPSAAPRRLAGEDLAVGAHLVGLRVDLDRRRRVVVDHALLGDLARVSCTATSSFWMPSFAEPGLHRRLRNEHHRGRGARAAERAEHRPVVDRLRRRDRRIGIAHRRGDDHAALDDAVGLDAEESRRHSTRSASLPFSTEPMLARCRARSRD